MSKVKDELAIRNLVTRYADAVNRRDEEAWAATWSKDALWSLPGAGEIAGRDAIVTTWRNAMSGFPWVFQLIYHGLVEIKDDSATGRWTLAEYLQVPDGNGMFNIGVYQDEYVRNRKKWKFAKRIYSVAYNDSSPGALAGNCIPYPELI